MSDRVRAWFRTAVTVALMAWPALLGAQGEGEFRAATPEDLEAGQENLPATPFVFAAYAAVWVVLVVYVLTLWRRISKAEREIADVAARLEDRTR
jgi:CcmD family protein